MSSKLHTQLLSNPTIRTYPKLHNEQNAMLKDFALQYL